MCSVNRADPAYFKFFNDLVYPSSRRWPGWSTDRYNKSHRRYTSQKWLLGLLRFQEVCCQLIILPLVTEMVLMFCYIAAKIKMVYWLPVLLKQPHLWLPRLRVREIGLWFLSASKFCKTTSADFLDANLISQSFISQRERFYVIALFF